MKDFIVLGGDLRFIYAAAKLNLNDSYNCSVYGFDKLHTDVHKETGVSVLKKIRKSANVILPLPMSRNCDFITAPYYSGKMPIIDTINAVAADNATIYCGKACPVLHELCKQKGFTLVDYFEREELIVLNAAIAAFPISLSAPTNPLIKRFFGACFSP